ncbi:glycosyltransferase [Oscillibacter sp.]|uniref:glycosyltransferase n=1 Tax=Oscillibacter sp. TaxID=1945593 RepID=UPI00262B531C|nr:glycosyltransferase [Oscillibacter sp.]MDD3346975.1 glycosyltransferase [Oscillibacter sp.]
MNPTVSIIVPVYNAEGTIARCVESILGQEYGDFELLLVNDGSRDGSGALCDAYARQDPRVRVIHKENTGVSDTRNIGIAQAKGTYLQFLDSDDWITQDATSQLVRTAWEHQCDLVISDFYRVVGDRVSHKGDIEETTVLSREEYAAHMMERPADFYYGVLWNKLYRRELVERHRLQMNPEISWCEDFMFNLEYIRFAERFYALQVPIYYYVKTKGSLASQSLSITETIRMKLTVFEYYNRFFKTVLDEEDYEKSRLKVYKFLVEAAGDGAVPPAILPGSKKLGDERISVPAIAGEGQLLDAFRERKLLEAYLETVALKYGLSMQETRLMRYLSQTVWVGPWKDLADVLDLPRRTLASTLQKLTAKGLIQTAAVETPKEKTGQRRPTEKSRVRQMRILCLSAAQRVLADLCVAQEDYERCRTQGLSAEELERYGELVEKIRANVQRALQ